MYNVIKKHSRRLLAVASALLMVAFLVPFTGNRGGGNEVVGTADGKKLHVSDLREAQMEWQMLRRGIAVPSSSTGTERYQFEPLAAKLGEHACAEIDENPYMLMLLKEEARKLGIVASD